MYKRQAPYGLARQRYKYQKLRTEPMSQNEFNTLYELSLIHISGRRPRRRVYVDFTVFEEVGHGGAVIPQDVVEMLSVDMGCVGTGLSLIHI